MAVHRRDVLCGLGFAAAAAFRDVHLHAASDFPRRADFLIDPGHTYLNAAYTHPIPNVSMDAVRRAASGRGTLPSPSGGQSGTPKSLFAALINAKPSEIAYVSSTSAGENLVVQALDLDRRFDGNVVTDGLHFEGALLHLLELRKQGLDLRIVKPTRDARIDFKDLERAVDRKTRLIEVSSVSMYNGFQHDLKAVCDLAHANGALVYADIIHSAGAQPFDVKAIGVDFAACSTFKWLMGDFGIGFLYAREDLLDRLRRPVMGYYQAPDLEQYFPPNLPEGPYVPVTYAFQKSAGGLFRERHVDGRAGPQRRAAHGVAELHHVAGRREHSGAPPAAARAASAGRASTWIRARDPAGVHRAHRHVREAEPRGRRNPAQASGGERQRADRNRLDAGVAVGLQRHAGRRAAARRLVMTACQRASRTSRTSAGGMLPTSSSRW